MGGAESEVQREHATVVLEAANFTRSQIMRTSQQLGLRTDGSNRWEKGVDPHLAPVASRAAARLLVEICGAHMTPRPDRRQQRPAAARCCCACAWSAWLTITALEVSLARAVEILDRLGFDPRAGQGTIDVRVPTAALRSTSRARST